MIADIHEDCQKCQHHHHGHCAGIAPDAPESDCHMDELEARLDAEIEARNAVQHTPGRPLERLSVGFKDRFHGHGDWGILDSDNQLVAELQGALQTQANAERLRDCWNACEGINDPEAVPEAIRALQRIRSRVNCDWTTPEGINAAVTDIINAADAALALATDGKD